MNTTAIKRIFDIAYYQLNNFDSKDALVTKYNDTWIKTSTKAYIEKANTISRGLIKIGVQKDDKIAIISSNNRTDWHILDIGILQIGAQNVPIYPNISKDDYAYILNHSECKYCFVSDAEVLEKINAVKARVPALEHIYTFDEIIGEKNWKIVFNLGKDEQCQDIVEQRKAQVKPEDLATIIYTSGTTGKPKGVMLSHRNIVSNVMASAKRLPIESGKKALSFLPICHVFERTIIYVYQYCGISVYFAESKEKISDNLKEIKPHIITVVPRLLEKIYDKIHEKGNRLSFFKKMLFLRAIRLGGLYKPYKGNSWWYRVRLSIYRKLIFDKWQNALGGELKLIISGSVALQTRLNRIFAAAGIPIMEGYGLTETSPVIAVNDQRNHGWKLGTVGKIIDAVEVKIAEDGEILCKGPNIMMGYYKDPERTHKAIKEGYLYTGDIGAIDSEGFLSITDRKKEIFKTSGGKYISPQTVENEMKQSHLIEQIMVIGEGKKMPAAFIQPNFNLIIEWAAKNNISIGDTNEDIIKHPKVIERIHKEVLLYNERFGKWERIKKFELTPDVWTIESGHLTPTMKLKRHSIKNKYKHLYYKIYPPSLDHVA